MEITETTSTERTFTLTGVTLTQIQLIRVLTGRVNSAGTARDAHDASTALYNEAVRFTGRSKDNIPFKADMGTGIAITLNKI